MNPCKWHCHLCNQFYHDDSFDGENLLFLNDINGYLVIPFAIHLSFCVSNEAAGCSLAYLPSSGIPTSSTPHDLLGGHGNMIFLHLHLLQRGRVKVVLEGFFIQLFESMSADPRSVEDDPCYLDMPFRWLPIGYAKGLALKLRLLQHSCTGCFTGRSKRAQVGKHHLHCRESGLSTPGLFVTKCLHVTLSPPLIHVLLIPSSFVSMQQVSPRDFT